MKTISNQDYNQQISILHKSLREEKDRLFDVFKKRETFRRTYNEVLQALAENDYATAAQIYFSKADKHLQKRDYDTTSVLALLGTICLVKSSQDFTKVQEYTEGRFLKSTFSIKVLKLLLTSKSEELKDIYEASWNLMKVIPVFDEEKPLIFDMVSF